MVYYHSPSHMKNENASKWTLAATITPITTITTITPLSSEKWTQSMPSNIERNPEYMLVSHLKRCDAASVCMCSGSGGQIKCNFMMCIHGTQRPALWCCWLWKLSIRIYSCMENALAWCNHKGHGMPRLPVHSFLYQCYWCGISAPTPQHRAHRWKCAIKNTDELTFEATGWDGFIVKWVSDQFVEWIVVVCDCCTTPNVLSPGLTLFETDKIMFVHSLLVSFLRGTVFLLLLFFRALCMRSANAVHAKCQSIWPYIVL